MTLEEYIYQDIAAWRRQIIENEFSELNEMQQQAVYTVSGPLLVFAGAGSGKTTVLVNRIANILRWGSAYETDRVFGEYDSEELEIIRRSAENKEKLPDELAQRLSVGAPAPWRILAITFTNKAAGELRERICNKVGNAGMDIWASTFHAACGRILRKNAYMIGYSEHFTVYDGDDQKRIIKECLKTLQIDEKMISSRACMSEISNAKDNLMTPDDFMNNAGNDSRLVSIAKVYKLYQDRLVRADAMDFDDMIFNTVVLLRDNPEVLGKYSNQFKYIMVDEYQDTNSAQYELVRLLASTHGNLCVVGDDDQSIYSFRGATVRNILEFEKDFPDSSVIKLEQNYRSTKTILSAANAVISNNSARKVKTLWTSNDTGVMITRYNASDERDESSFIADTITESVEKGGKYSDFAVLYRMNSQSQTIERALVRSAIPYRVIGGRRFYERREIRDMIAYLSVISNHSDDNRLKRIINIPKRGIGDKTVSQLEEIGSMLGQSMYETAKSCEEFEVLIKSREKLLDFCRLVDDMTHELEVGNPISEMYSKLVERIEYVSFILHESDHGDEAVENIRELKSSIMRYENENPDNATLQGFLEEVSLLTDIDSFNNDDEDDRVVLMTLHSAKGLEFNKVFIPGMEENTFPSYMAQMSDSEMQEERRLAYVGITRAKKQLYFITSKQRTLFGKTNYNRPSRFLSEIPMGLVEEKEKERPVNYIKPGIMQKERKANDFAQSKLISTSPQKGKTDIDFQSGMRVRHARFGEGMILSVRKMANDTLLEIAFDEAGTKKLMANYANLSVI